MKKFLSLLTLVALSSFMVVNAAESRLENYVNKKLSPITQKEKDFNAKVEAQQKANAAKQEEYKKQQEARKAALEKQKQEAAARRQATKDAVQAEKDYWNSILKR